MLVICFPFPVWVWLIKNESAFGMEKVGVQEKKIVDICSFAKVEKKEA